jgi:lipopolysaccharide transport system ATP-binding protein
MNGVIKVENLGKKYIIGHQKQRYDDSLRDAMTHTARGIWQRIRHPLSPNRESIDLEELWALKDINFEVQQGERVGIIGRNGAGKSTLLKILSRITEPTTGKVRIKGRVSSLLEVGTGFHPELTGRENIFLNGAILGMSRQEIKRKFDEIIAFAELEKFLDTPVKRYSSGMYVRLAFAVAAHLEPEILIVDEVLAVGDAQFQKKCLGKMENVAKEGRTVLFVSHNMQAVKQLCRIGIVLKNGSIAYNGMATKAVEEYLHNDCASTSLKNLSNMIASLPEDPVFKLENITITQKGLPVDIVENGKPLEIAIEYEVFQRTRGLRVYIDLCDTDGTILFRSFHDEDNNGIPTVEPGRYLSKALIPKDFLAPRNYELRIRGTIYNVRVFEPKEGICIKFNVARTGMSNRAYLSDSIRGKLAPFIKWKTSKTL